jgi:hypothetical protein
MTGILFKRSTKPGGTLFPPSAARACTDSLRLRATPHADRSMCALHPKENAAANGTRTARRGGKCIERLLLRTHRQPIDEVAFRRELTDIRGRKAKTPAAPQ